MIDTKLSQEARIIFPHTDIMFLSPLLQENSSPSCLKVPYPLLDLKELTEKPVNCTSSFFPFQYVSLFISTRSAVEPLNLFFFFLTSLYYILDLTNLNQ